MIDATPIAERLFARREKITVTESSAGGLISAALLAIPGASRYYLGGTIIYSLEGIAAQIGEIPPDTRSSSEPFARFLARTSRAKLGADWAVAETGASGPSGNRYGDPSGHAWLAVAGPGELLLTEHVLTGSDDREANMAAFAAAALALLGRALSDASG
ncbi:MAG TPA: CinA family protein [Solirubrobacteraceae bacterium]|nr:CinA family protein [Solirubrobacteraceae bacterium]